MARQHRSATPPKTSIARLEDHPEAYVTVMELAKYWVVSRKQIYKQIEAGTLAAVRFGPRLLRIRASEALRFEREAKMPRALPHERPAQIRLRSKNVTLESSRAPDREVARRGRR